jgi:hypothetical protein
LVIGIVSAPLWDSKSSTFAGLLTTSDYINVIQYYWQNPDALARVDQFRLNSLRGEQLLAHTNTWTDVFQKLRRRLASSPLRPYPSTPTAQSTRHAV